MVVEGGGGGGGGALVLLVVSLPPPVPSARRYMIGRLNTNIAAQYTTMSTRLRDTTINDRYCSALDNANVALMNTVRNIKILDDIGGGGGEPGLDFLLLSTLLFPTIVCHTVNTTIEDNVLPNMTINGDGTVLVLLLLLLLLLLLFQCTISTASPCVTTIASPMVNVLGR
jgi:hypothetical protein